MIYFSKKRPLTWNGGFLYIMANPLLAGLLPRVNCPIFKSPSWPNPHPLFPSLPANTSIAIYTYSTPANTSIAIHTDDINMPEFSSIGHNFYTYRRQSHSRIFFCGAQEWHLRTGFLERAWPLAWDKEEDQLSSNMKCWFLFIKTIVRRSVRDAFRIHWLSPGVPV